MRWRTTGGLSALLILPLALVGLRAADDVSRTLLLAGGTAGQTVVAVGERGAIFRSANEGVTWTAAKCPSRATLTGVSFADPRRGWVVGHDATILATQDGGLTWSKQWQGANLADSFLDVAAIDDRHVIAIGAYGLYLTTSDGGQNWTSRKIIGDDYHLNRITRSADGMLYIAGEHGTLLRSRNLGASWVAIPTNYDGSFYGVLPLRSGTLLAYGLRGRVFRSEDEGEHWAPIASGAGELIAAGVETPAGQIVLAGQIRSLRVSRDDGRTFTAADARVASGIAELILPPGGALIALGEAGALRIEPAQIAAEPAARK